MSSRAGGWELPHPVSVVQHDLREVQPGDALVELGALHVCKNPRLLQGFPRHIRRGVKPGSDFPVDLENNLDLFEIIKKGEYEFPSPYWDMVSELAKDLIRNLLVVDPHKRYDSNQILMHPWIVGEKTPRKQLPSVTSKMREFNGLKNTSKFAGLEEHKSK